MASSSMLQASAQRVPPLPAAAAAAACKAAAAHVPPWLRTVQVAWRQAASFSAEAGSSGAAADAAPSSSPAEPVAAAAEAASVSVADTAAAAAAAEAAAPAWAAHTGVKTLDGLPMPSWIVAVPKPKRAPMGLQVRTGPVIDGWRWFQTHNIDFVQCLMTAAG